MKKYKLFGIINIIDLFVILVIVLAAVFVGTKFLGGSDEAQAPEINITFTTKEVSDFVGVSEATISRWESGDIDNMRRDRIYALAKVLQISPLVILGVEPERSEDADKHELVTIYNNMNQEGREKILDYARMLQKTGEYNIYHKTGVVEKEAK